MAVPTTTLAGPRSAELDDLDKAIESHPIWTELRGPLNQFTIQNFDRSQGSGGNHDLIVHGTPEGEFKVDGQTVSPEQIAAAVLENDDYVEGTPITLVTCHGSCGQAQAIQEILGVEVTSSPETVDLDPVDGSLRENPAGP